jgi:hypothetical protein
MREAEGQDAYAAALSAGSAIKYCDEATQKSEHRESPRRVHLRNGATSAIATAITKTQKAKGERALRPQRGH